MADFNLRVLFTAKNEIGKAFSGVNKSFADMKSKLKGISDAGQKMTTRLTLPLVGLGALSVKTAVTFDDSMRKVMAVTGATADQFVSMREKALEMGAQTRFTASQAAQGMQFLAMAGLDVNQVMEAIPESLTLAAAGGIELAQAADIATNVMQAMRLEVKDLAMINDVLAKAQSSSNTNITEMGEAMRTVAGTAAALGVDINSLSGMLGTMANAGDKGSIAGTLLRNAMLAVTKPTKNMTNLIERLGFSIDQFVTESGDLKDFEVLVGAISDQGIDAATIMEAFGERGGRAILSMGAAGSKGLEELIQKMRDSSGAAKQMAEDMESGPGGALRKLISIVQTAAIKLGDALVPAMLKVIEMVKPFFDWFVNLNEETLKWIVIILGAVAALGPMLILITKVITVVKALSVAFALLNVSLGPVGLALTAIAASLMLIKKLRAGSKERREQMRTEAAASPFSEARRRRVRAAQGGVGALGGAGDLGKAAVDIRVTSDPGTTAAVTGVSQQGKGLNTSVNTENLGYGSTVRR